MPISLESAMGHGQITYNRYSLVIATQVMRLFTYPVEGSRTLSTLKWYRPTYRPIWVILDGVISILIALLVNMVETTEVAMEIGDWDGDGAWDSASDFLFSSSCLSDLCSLCLICRQFLPVNCPSRWSGPCAIVLSRHSFLLALNWLSFLIWLHLRYIDLFLNPNLYLSARKSAPQIFPSCSQIRSNQLYETIFKSAPHLTIDISTKMEIAPIVGLGVGLGVWGFWRRGETLSVMYFKPGHDGTIPRSN